VDIDVMIRRKGEGGMKKQEVLLSRRSRCEAWREKKS
jgi:hypothetical protein